MKIVKASAGSGKTFTLANTYINLLLNSPDRYAYRHILAVTFTNKATAEMKSRILKDLKKLSATEPRAKDLLVDILHDYSAFSVSTIDKFFQKALKVFSREIGQFSSYQLELDRQSLIREAADRILDSLTEDKKELVEWIKTSLKEKMENGGKFSFESGLYETGAQLKTEEFRQMSESGEMDIHKAMSKERLAELHRICKDIISDFVRDAAALGVKASVRERVKMPGKKVMKASEELQELFGKPFDIYNTAWEIDSQTYSLGLAGEFLREFDALLKERNLMCLDESNTILRDIIDGSDAPFVYEKMGIRYEHFLLDEFQDTSGIQWANFLPLLRESESSHTEGGNLIVGDVKQSIYRWRDSDWELLNTKVPEEFPEEKPVSLDSNWRSCPAIVNFNNDFFTFAAAELGASDIYADVKQFIKVKDEPQEGYVRVSFTDEQTKAVLESISEARSCGACWSDIAILVRDKKRGSETASFLMENGIPVISDDSLNLKSSPIVSMLTSLLGSSDNPNDSISAFLSSSLNVVWPDKYFSLVDLCENLLRQIRVSHPDLYDGQVLFIQAFMDDLQTWTSQNGDNLGEYLRHWKESNIFIGSPENSEAVRILTIHKSKGLEYPYLIFPFAEQVELYKENTHWCLIPETEDKRMSGIYPVTLGNDSRRTLFAPYRQKEGRLQTIDSLNLFYVAMTRASKVMHIIADNPTKTFLTSESKGTPEYKNMSQLLFHHLGGMYEYNMGTPYDFSSMKRESMSEESTFPSKHDSVPLGERLLPSEEAMDFFGEDGVTGPAASARIDGIILHGILSEVKKAEDLPEAVRNATTNGLLTEEEGKSAYRLLHERISSHPEWFPTSDNSACKISNEIAIIGDDGELHRPDRVVELADGSIVVVDYKFGERRKSYARQVRGYMELYRKMGWADVKGTVWYVREDERFDC